MFEEGQFFSVTLLFLDIATNAKVKKNTRILLPQKYLPTVKRLLKICKPLTGAAVCLKLVLLTLPELFGLYHVLNLKPHNLSYTNSSRYSSSTTLLPSSLSHERVIHNS